MAILSLVPTPSVAATSTGSENPARLRSNRPPKPPISASAPAPRGGPHQRLDQLDHAVAGIDIDAGLGIGEALVSHGVLDLCVASRTWELQTVQRVDRRYTRKRAKESAGTGSAREPGRAGVSIPNLITLARILLVPVVIWAITSGEMRIAFLLFFAAGASDAVDGFLAKRFGMATELGAYLDPLADKAMIVSIYVALGIAEAIPRWLVILVVSRDIMIVGAVMLSWLVDKPVALKPLMVSKLNTVAQIMLALIVLGALGFNFDAWLAIVMLTALVAALTLLSIAFYVAEWVRHMNAADSGP